MCSMQSSIRLPAPHPTSVPPKRMPNDLDVRTPQNSIEAPHTLDRAWRRSHMHDVSSAHRIVNDRGRALPECQTLSSCYAGTKTRHGTARPGDDTLVLAGLSTTPAASASRLEAATALSWPPHNLQSQSQTLRSDMGNTITVGVLSYQDSFYVLVGNVWSHLTLQCNPVQQ